jgi:2-polyprenyl-3-methyl-5-hydroxy-6-metoxy-1,4-benzoquinol methylase
MSRTGVRCWGLDFGAHAVGKLNGRFADDGNVEEIIDIGQISGFREHFDTVFLIEAIEHMPDRHLGPSMEAILSALKPGGWLVVSTPNDEDIEAAEVYCPVSRVAFHPMQHLRSWNEKTLLQYLGEAGFVAVDCRQADLQALPYHSRKEWLKRLLKRALYGNYKDPHLVAFARKPDN